MEPRQLSYDLSLMEKALVTFDDIQVPKAKKGEDSLRVNFIASDESIDRDQERMKVDGFNLKSYRKNPVVLWAHDHRRHPIGNSKVIKIEGKKLKLGVDFTPEEINPFGFQTYKLYEGGFLHAGSIGFGDAKREYADKPAPGQPWATITSCEIWEYSSCNVPSNRNALQEARSKGILNDVGLAYFSEGMPAPDQRLLTINVDGGYQLDDAAGSRTIQVQRDIRGTFGKTVDGLYVPVSIGFDMEKWDMQKGIDWVKANAPALRLNDEGVSITIKMESIPQPKSVDPEISDPTPDPGTGKEVGGSPESEPRLSEEQAKKMAYLLFLRPVRSKQHPEGLEAAVDELFADGDN